MGDKCWDVISGSKIPSHYIKYMYMAELVFDG